MSDDGRPAGEVGTIPPGEEVLARFLGDESFPVTWSSDVEKQLFWVYDDLHIPHPVSPMFFDIGGWWLSCDHMFRRFGTPFAVDWLATSRMPSASAATSTRRCRSTASTSRIGGATGSAPRWRRTSATWRAAS